MHNLSKIEEMKAKNALEDPYAFNQLEIIMDENENKDSLFGNLPKQDS